MTLPAKRSHCNRLWLSDESLCRILRPLLVGLSRIASMAVDAGKTATGMDDFARQAASSGRGTAITPTAAIPRTSEPSANINRGLWGAVAVDIVSSASE